MDMLLRLCALAGAWAAGADQNAGSPGGRPREVPLEVVYYFDGAGGGGPMLNWGRGIRRGLQRAGFAGEFEDVDWQTGLGPLLDHSLGESDKRNRARAAAEEIMAAMARHPKARVHLIGLSAGTAVLLHTLEALPPGRPVETVVLLSSSVSADYDLTRALEHVRGGLYAFASRHDPVLNTVVPMLGTADREFRLLDTAGLRGFRTPAGATPRVKALYSRLRNIPWRPEFAEYGNLGTHTGATGSDFVARFIAPLLREMRGEQAAASRPAPPGTAGR